MPKHLDIRLSEDDHALLGSASGQIPLITWARAALIDAAMAELPIQKLAFLPTFDSLQAIETWLEGSAEHVGEFDPANKIGVTDDETTNFRVEAVRKNLTNLQSAAASAPQILPPAQAIHGASLTLDLSANADLTYLARMLALPRPAILRTLVAAMLKPALAGYDTDHDAS